MPIPTDSSGGARWLIERIFGSDDASDITTTTQAELEVRIQQVNITRDTLFKKLWRNYPVNSSAPEAYELVGGQAWALHLEKPEAYTNACALRFSRSLNYSGYIINNQDSGFYTVRGEDKLNYLLRVRETIKFVEKKFGNPTYMFKSSEISMSEVHSQLMGKTGIIIFDISGWSDATGHVTLWNGSTCGDSCYFNPNPPARTNRVIFWEIE